MALSLLEQLPKIVAEGKREAANILARLETPYRIGLQTRELVIPSRDMTWQDGHMPELQNMNRLIYGDNLLAMAALLAGDSTTPSMRGKIDLIYIDPPFCSKRDYYARIDNHQILAYSDRYSLSDYLAMIVPRLILMRELLSEQGSIYVHLDWHVGHYVKIVMDDIFGKESFRNEIIWHYYNKMQGNIGRFPSNHDAIYAYKKNENPYFIAQREERERVKRQSKRVWDPGSKSLKQARDANGNLLYYEDTHRTIDDVWRIPYIGPGNKTRKLNFATQKPENLLERIILSSSRPDSVLMDCFVGSGTLAAVAERLGRKWIACDLGKPACMITRKRLIDQGAQPFLYQYLEEV